MTLMFAWNDVTSTIAVQAVVLPVALPYISIHRKVVLPIILCNDISFNSPKIWFELEGQQSVRHYKQDKMEKKTLVSGWS